MKTQVLIIGGGTTGTGLARDLALRGVQCILAEQQDLNHGASGGNHGLLHSGARYVTDPHTAKECRDEGALLKQLASHCIDDTGGLFIAVQGDDEKYIADFPGMCLSCGIQSTELDLKDALELEPGLSEKMIAAYKVNDASVDPFMLSLENISDAQSRGTKLLRYNKVTGFKREGTKITSTTLCNTRTGEITIVEADQVVNATGTWADEVAKIAGAEIDMVYSKGSLLVTQNRMTRHVINRLRKAADADILVPGGTVSILGTTSVRIDSLDEIYPEVDEVDFIIREGADMFPALETTRYIRAYCGVRPLVQSKQSNDDRDVSRGFALLDHLDSGLENFTTITGGKLTTYRLMAEKTADLVCERLGISAECKTRTEPLPSTKNGKYTEPGLTPKIWIEKNNPEDLLLCECEMVPQSVVDYIITSIQEQNQTPNLYSIGLRSRIGKGPCQGSFCSLRLAAYMYDKGILKGISGIEDLKAFACERWRGEHPLLWDMPLIQSEIKEAMLCGIFGLEG